MSRSCTRRTGLDCSASFGNAEWISNSSSAYSSSTGQKHQPNTCTCGDRRMQDTHGRHPENSPGAKSPGSSPTGPVYPHTTNATSCSVRRPCQSAPTDGAVLVTFYGGSAPWPSPRLPPTDTSSTSWTIQGHVPHSASRRLLGSDRREFWIMMPSSPRLRLRHARYPPERG